MAMIKCKMCGGDLNVTEGMTVAECEYCGTKQTVPNVDNEKKLTLFSRANRLRLACEFDKAAGVYENIVAEFPEEAEAYWGLVLCKYGIEYVDDPATGKKVPTCHRSSFDSILEDGDFEQACENADAVARRVYREEAKAIEDIRKGILEVSGKEPPYDIFICYKETDENGERTVDSVLAQDVYDALTEKGYRVFFSRITLEDKLGTEYEPYIFAALNSAKIMLVFGTDYEYFNAVWVKNEWSRFLKLMAQDKSKHLIPCYKNVDAYDMPKEFQKLQGQDMGKVGAVQDLLRGIDKLLGKGQAAQAAAPAQAVGGPTVDSLLKRGQMFLEDEDWDSADEYFDKVLDMVPECAEAYVGKLCAEGEYTDLAQMAEETDLDLEAPNLKKAIRFAVPELRAQLEEYLASAKMRIQEQKVEMEKQEEERKRVREQARERLEPIRKKIQKARSCIAVSLVHAVGLRTDGTVLASGSNSFGACNVSTWRNIVAVAADFGCTIGLKADGTVVATGRNDDMRCNVGDWKNITAIATNQEFGTIGIRADGTIASTGGKYDLSTWTDIVSIKMEYDKMIGLRKDGTVLVPGSDPSICVSDWHDIVDIAAGISDVYGLAADGTVVASGYGGEKYEKVSSWTDIVAIFGMGNTVFGLKADGSVVAAGEDSRRVHGWKDIVAICGNSNCTVGLKADGTVVVSPRSTEIESDRMMDWKLFHNVDMLEQERIEARQHRQRQRRFLVERRALIRPAASCIARTYENVIAVKSDGTLLWAGKASSHTEAWNQYRETALSWKNISQVVLVEKGHTATFGVIGVRMDGSLVWAGKNLSFLDEDVWTDLTAVVYTELERGFLNKGYHDVFVGLKRDGHIILRVTDEDKLVGKMDKLREWDNLTKIIGGSNYIAGLKSDGTVVYTQTFGDNLSQTREWTGIVDIATAYREDIIGLKEDGTVVTTEYSPTNRNLYSNWPEVAALASCISNSIGIKYDGTVVAKHVDKSTEEQLSAWRDIVAVSSYISSFVGVKADGTVVTTNDKYDVSGWKLFNRIETLEQERKEAQAAFEQECRENQSRLQEEQAALQTELANLKGLFTGKRRKEIEARLAEIKNELKKL